MKTPDSKTIPLSSIGWICRECWQSGTAAVRSIAEKQHEDFEAHQKKAQHLFTYVVRDHEPNIVMRDEMASIDFEGLIGEKRPLDLDGGEPIKIQ